MSTPESTKKTRGPVKTAAQKMREFVESKRKEVGKRAHKAREAQRAAECAFAELEKASSGLEKLEHAAEAMS